MILVLNLRQLLSGSRVLFLVIASYAFYSCETAKAAKKNKTTTFLETKVDTVVWYPDRTGPEPITSEGIVYKDEKDPISENAENGEIPNSEKLSTYNIGLLIPFYSNQFSTANAQSIEKSKRAINFYGGIQLAIAKLNRQNVSLNVNIYDSNGSETECRNKLYSTELMASDLIIGPFKRQNAELGSEFSKAQKKPFLSPMNPSTKIATENPYFIQAKPGLEVHCKAIGKHVLEKFNPSEVVLVCRNKSAEVQRLKYFQTAKNEFFNDDKTGDFQEYIISDYGSNFSNMDFFKFFPAVLPQDTKLPDPIRKVFIIPSWSSEAFINNALRLIRLAKQHHEVYVYGMPKWREYEKIDFEYYEALNLHLSSDGFIDSTSSQAKSFKRDYYYKFADLPTDDAFYGYDLMMYMSQMLTKHGSQFQTKLDVEPYTGIHTSFNFQAIYAEDKLEEGKLDFIENKHVDIIRFKDFYFQSAE